MDSYVTGTAIRQLREAKHLTQAELAEKLAVSAKAISKWETARGLPDISLSKYPLIRRFLNGETYLSKPQVSLSQYIT